MTQGATPGTIGTRIRRRRISISVPCRRRWLDLFIVKARLSPIGASL